MNKSAFTMIELVFVILVVIMLMAIAIPKLTTTKDDAMAIILTIQIKEGTKELITYYGLQGNKINFSEINSSVHSSRIIFSELVKNGWGRVVDNNHFVIYSNKKTNAVCINYQTDGFQIEVEVNSTNHDTLCQDIKRVMPADRNYSILNNVVNF
jgi:type II secretory pathway pseudopilin PulG